MVGATEEGGGALREYLYQFLDAVAGDFSLLTNIKIDIRKVMDVDERAEYAEYIEHSKRDIGTILDDLEGKIDGKLGSCNVYVRCYNRSVLVDYDEISPVLRNVVSEYFLENMGEIIPSMHMLFVISYLIDVFWDLDLKFFPDSKKEDIIIENITDIYRKIASSIYKGNTSSSFSSSNSIESLLNSLSCADYIINGIIDYIYIPTMLNSLKNKVKPEKIHQKLRNRANSICDKMCEHDDFNSFVSEIGESTPKDFWEGCLHVVGDYKYLKEIFKDIIPIINNSLDYSCEFLIAISMVNKGLFSCFNVKLYNNEYDCIVLGSDEMYVVELTLVEEAERDKKCERMLALRNSAKNRKEVRGIILHNAQNTPLQKSGECFLINFERFVRMLQSKIFYPNSLYIDNDDRVIESKPGKAKAAAYSSRAAEAVGLKREG